MYPSPSTQFTCASRLTPRGRARPPGSAHGASGSRSDAARPGARCSPRPCGRFKHFFASSPGALTFAWLPFPRSQMPQPKPARSRPAKKRRRRRATARRGLPLAPLLLSLAAAAAVVVAVLTVGSDSQATVSERIVTVSQGVVQSVVSGSGNLEPANQLDVSFGTTGRITKIYVEEGDHVSKGDLLAKLDDASQRVDLAQAQAQLVDARDALTTAEDAATEDAAASSESGTTVAVAAQVTPTVTPSVT